MSEIEKQKKRKRLKKALIICNGNPPPQNLLRQLWQEVDYRVAADGGANQLHELKLVPDAVVGDLDSLLPEVQQQLPVSILYHVINLLGADGGRQDQFLSSLEILFKYSPQARLILWTPMERMEFILDTWKETLTPGTTLSLLPLFGGAQGVVTQGLEFELNNHVLLPGKTPAGVSNLVISNPVSVKIQQGQLLLVVQHTESYSTNTDSN